MEFPEIPEGVEPKLFSEDPIERGRGLQQIVDTLEDNRLKAERAILPILEINRSWDLKDREVAVIGKVFGPRPEDPSENAYLDDVVDGYLYGLSFLEMKFGDDSEFVITIAVIRTIQREETGNLLAETPQQNLTYHAPVRENPLLLTMAS